LVAEPGYPFQLVFFFSYHGRMVLIRVLTLALGASAYTSLNDPLLPGNSNFPGAGAGYVSEQGLPVINVKYRFPVIAGSEFIANAESDLALHRRMDALSQELAADQGIMRRSFLAARNPADSALSALSHVKATGPVPAPENDFSEMLLGMSHSAPPSAATTSGGVASIKTPSGARDYSASCPIGFRHTGGTTCEAASYAGPCQGAFDFNQWNAAMLARFEEQCGASWPAK
jgi:CPW-WPC domain-containing protein